MIDKVNKVRDLAQDERFDEALKLIAEIEKTTQLTPSLLVLKGICLELSDSGHKPEEAEQAFKAALEMDDEHLDALNELGSHYLTVEASPSKAMPLFEKAVDICESYMTESVLGLTMCLLESAGKERALRFLQDIKKSPMDMERIEEAEREIRSQGNGRK